MTTQSNNILLQASGIIYNRSEESDRNYGPFSEGMERAASIASGMSGKDMDARDMFNALIALKLSRESYCHKEDNMLDLVAYVAAKNNYEDENPRPKPLNKKVQILKDIFKNGEKIIVRDSETIECLDFSFKFDNAYEARFWNLDGRKFSSTYIKEELKWYFNADRYDTSICEHAKIWKKLICEDGGINSNYGAIIFNGPFENVIKMLKADKYSRRAVIMIADNETYASDCQDYHCTKSLTFNIRKNKLNMSVEMRSNDAVFGLTNDAAFFTILQEMLLVKMKVIYPELSMGYYNHSANSMHIYKRHYNMVKNIIENNKEFETVCPKISSAIEVDFLLSKNKMSFKDDFEFSKWLIE